MTSETEAEEVRRMLDRMGDIFAKNGYGEDFDAVEEYVKYTVEDGTMWPEATLTTSHSLSWADRLRGKKEVPVDNWFSMGVMLGTALERDVPADSEMEDQYRDGEFILPEEVNDE